jgi:hypothetical protein
VSVVRTVVPGRKRYYYLVHTYRWAGEVGRREKYPGTTRPQDLHMQRATLEREVWEATWNPVFREISASYQERRRTLPKSVAEK